MSRGPDSPAVHLLNTLLDGAEGGIVSEGIHEAVDMVATETDFDALMIRCDDGIRIAIMTSHTLREVLVVYQSTVMPRLVTTCSNAL